MATVSVTAFKVRVDGDLRKHVEIIRKSMRRNAKGALDKVARSAESESIKAVAGGAGGKRKIPGPLVRYRFNIRGQKKGKRVTLRRPSVQNLVATLEVYMRGIPTFQLGKAKAVGTGKRSRIKRGVKVGGRYYEGAFISKSPKSEGMIFKPLRAEIINAPRAQRGQGSRGGRLMMPKVGVRQRLDKEFRARTSGQAAHHTFDKEFNRLLRKAISRANAQAGR